MVVVFGLLVKLVPRRQCPSKLTNGEIQVSAEETQVVTVKVIASIVRIICKFLNSTSSSIR